MGYTGPIPQEMKVEAEATAVEQIAAIRGREWAAENSALIIDVREPHEWAMGTLPGAELIRLKVKTEWPASVVKLAGAWQDMPLQEELRRPKGTDAPREEL